MININARIVFIALQNLNAKIIVFNIVSQCAITSQIALNITLDGFKCNTMQRHFLSLILLINAQFILIALQKLIPKKFYLILHPNVPLRRKSL